MGKFKVGDRVRALNSAEGQFTAGREYVVSGINQYSINIKVDDGGDTNNGWGPDNFELVETKWQPKVGDRVRWRGVFDASMYTVGKVYEIKSGRNGYLFLTDDKNNAEYGNHQWDAESIVDHFELAPALTIEAGKFYTTRDGRKVGPMAWSTEGHFYVELKLGTWRKDGTAHPAHEPTATDIGDLIAEWVDEPAVAASNDNAAPAKFKVGDRVRGYAPAWGEKTGVIVQIDPHDYDQHYRIKDDETDWSMWLENHTVEAAPVLPTAIVALIEDGQPKPNTRPFVHTTEESARAEADRLASNHKGQQFGVYVLTTTSQEAAPTYAHEWQRLAAKGEKIAAIKELRCITGLGLKSTKDAVEHWLANDEQRSRIAA